MLDTYATIGWADELSWLSQLVDELVVLNIE